MCVMAVSTILSDLAGIRSPLKPPSGAVEGVSWGSIQSFCFQRLCIMTAVCVTPEHLEVTTIQCPSDPLPLPPPQTRSRFEGARSEVYELMKRIREAPQEYRQTSPISSEGYLYVQEKRKTAPLCWVGFKSRDLIVRLTCAKPSCALNYC